MDAFINSMVLYIRNLVEKTTITSVSVQCNSSLALLKRNNQFKLFISIDLYHTVAMSSLRRIKSFCFCTASLALNIASGRGLPCENKDFYSPETQHGRRVIGVYACLIINGLCV